MEHPRITLALALVGGLSAVALLSAPYVRAEEEFVDCRVTTCTSNDWVRALSATPPANPSVNPPMLTRGGIPMLGGGSTAALPAAAAPTTTALAVNVLFASNSDKIPPKYYASLNELGKALTQVPSAIEIAGHTDNIGSAQANQLLSERRAWSVRQYLVQHFSLPPERLIAKGYGKGRPRVTNDTPEGRSINRRIEIMRAGS